MKGRHVVGWSLDRAERALLLERFPPAYPDVIADHVTLAARVSRQAPLPCETSGEIVGISNDGNGVQALVVRIGGTTDRPDGSTYHITWSLDRSKGRRPVESNDVIARLGWEALPEALPLTLRPARFP
ncbi:hypothetical protein [Telmatospirillum sp. J64-1]|uniref:hypothetical protein n=1 Tax=Telmatospirillum sp. J64-1 TaxID=2502183 RepID=UPI00115D61F1|nr:hypothetical protein [Telmatospirillum sp. J64-1]